MGARIKEKYKDSPDEVMFNPLAQNARVSASLLYNKRILFLLGASYRSDKDEIREGQRAVEHDVKNNDGFSEHWGKL